MDLLEREEELSYLRQLYGQSQAGNGSLAIVTGPTGSGKTHLLSALAEQVTAAGGQFVGASASLTEWGLPLGVIDQVFHGLRLPEQSARRIGRLLGEGVLSAMLPEGAAPGGPRIAEHIRHSCFLALAELAATKPLVIGIDDLHVADPASVECLSYLVARLDRVRILVVVTEAAEPAEPPARRVGLARTADVPHLRLGMLSPHAVHILLRDRLGARAAQELAAECHTITGGNPMITRALVEECRSQEPPAVLRPTASGAFGQAFTHCLERCGQRALTVARALAVLGRSANPARLAALCGLSAAAVRRAVWALDSAGLLACGMFRHHAARAAVLNSLPGKERAAWHARAAELLRDEDEAAPEVAEQLLAADGAEPSWAVPVLQEAARRLLGTGEVDRAFTCLRLALRIGTDERQRVVTMAMLADAQWRVDPSVAVRHLDDLVAAAMSGELDGRSAVILVDRLVWFGQVEDAVRLVKRLSERPSDRPSERSVPARARPDADEVARVDGARRRLNRVFPHTAAGADPPAGDALTTAARLRGQPLDDHNWPAMFAALSVLIQNDHLASAGAWCADLLAYATAQRAPSWRAVLVAARAHIALRRGDLQAADADARTALSLITTKSWGVAIGYPLTVLVRANTAMGLTDVAHHYLRVPVPEAMFRSVVGLRYLEARGIYYRTTARYSAALTDFMSCGELMSAWGADIPLPWRVEAAKTYLRLGEPVRARDLVVAQMSLPGPAMTRAHGACLRALAATHAPARRLALLDEAARTLHRCGDRVELAHTLADLGHTYEALGRRGQARALARQARQLAHECGLALLERQDGSRRGANPPAPRSGQHEPEGLDELSEAERRVAFLATQGLTNRQVANRLHITVSTVEQHLTRIYRKLNVSSRAELPLAVRATG